MSQCLAPLKCNPSSRRGHNFFVYVLLLLAVNVKYFQFVKKQHASWSCIEGSDDAHSSLSSILSQEMVLTGLSILSVSLMLMSCCLNGSHIDNSHSYESEISNESVFRYS